jgi:hypothetical protein
MMGLIIRVSIGSLAIPLIVVALTAIVIRELLAEYSVADNRSAA